MALSVPFFHHELVKQAVHLAMNSGAGDQREAILGLLDRCTYTLIIESFQHPCLLYVSYSLNILIIKIYFFIVDRLCTSVEVSQSQLAKGIRRVAENVGDLCLDNPAAKGQFEEVVQVGE